MNYILISCIKNIIHYLWCNFIITTKRTIPKYLSSFI